MYLTMHFYTKLIPLFVPWCFHGYGALWKSDFMCRLALLTRSTGL